MLVDPVRLPIEPARIDVGPEGIRVDRKGQCEGEQCTRNSGPRTPLPPDGQQQRQRNNRLGQDPVAEAPAAEPRIPFRIEEKEERECRRGPGYELMFAQTWDGQRS